jgi:hypothetical protein
VQVPEKSTIAEFKDGFELSDLRAARTLLQSS